MELSILIFGNLAQSDKSGPSDGDEETRFGSVWQLVGDQINDAPGVLEAGLSVEKYVIVSLDFRSHEDALKLASGGADTRIRVGF